MGMITGMRVGETHLALRDQVLSELRARIVNGVYPPGCRVTEERLGADLGVSRSPVREALRVLVAEGFVESQPRRGAVVAKPARGAVQDLLLVRERIETLAAGLAAQRATPDDIAGLREILERAKAAEEAQDFDALAVLNSEFHGAVIVAARNSWLDTLAGPLYEQVRWVFRASAADRAPHSWDEHLDLMQAIVDGDAERAEQAASAHVQAAKEAAAQILDD